VRRAALFCWFVFAALGQGQERNYPERLPNDPTYDEPFVTEYDIPTPAAYPADTTAGAFPSGVAGFRLLDRIWNILRRDGHAIHE